MENDRRDYGELFDRLERVERLNRRLWFSFWISLLALVALLTTGAMRDSVVRNPEEAFVLRDEGGRTRGTLGFENGLPGLRLYDQSGRKRLAMELWPKGDPYIELLNEEGETQAEFSLVNGDLPNLAFCDKQDQELVSLGINAYGSPSLELSNGSYDHHMDLTFFDDGYPKLALYGPDYDDRAVLGLSNSGYARLALYGPKEVERTVIQVMPSGAPSMFLRGNSGEMLFEAPTRGKK